MRYRYFLILVIILISTHCLPQSAGKPLFSPPTGKKFSGSHPSGFIENKGQIIDQNRKPDPDCLFLLNTQGVNVQLRRGGFSYDLYQVCSSQFSVTSSQLTIGNNSSHVPRPMSPASDSLQTSSFHRIDIDLLNANPACTIIPLEPAPDYLNYYTAGSPQQGIRNIRQYNTITYKDIYPGIDMEFSITPHRGCKYTFIVHPGASFSDISMKISGEEDVRLSRDSLIIMTSLGAIDEMIPESFYRFNNSKTNVQFRFREIEKGVYGFITDENIPPGSFLVIDPTTKRLWGTYYGGPDAESKGQCAVDKSGNVFLAGDTYSFMNIATSGAYKGTISGDFDGFLAKFNAAGQRQWATYFGGKLYDEVGSCIVSGNGNIYVSGHTASDTGIASSGAHQTVFAGGQFDCYIEKFNQAGSRVWGTYYGGAGSDYPGHLTVDKQENIFLAGGTVSDNGIATSGTYHSTRGGMKDAFLAKFNSSGVRQWGTYFGGEADDFAFNTTIDSSGNIYITGFTQSHTGVASTGAHQQTFGGWNDAFISKFTTGGQRVWSTYYGGTLWDTGLACCTDNSRNVYMAGKAASSTGIATPGSHQPLTGGSDDAFLVKFDSMGVRKWGTYYGGSLTEYAYSCSAGWNNEVFMAGITSSGTGMSTPDGYQPVLGGGNDGFLVKFNSSGVRQWGTYFGGPDDDEFLDCTYLKDDTLYLSGDTYSSEDIASPFAYQEVNWGSGDDMLIKFIECWPMAAAGAITGPTTVHQNSFGIQYSIPSIPHAATYVWTLPYGAAIMDGDGTNNITVNFSPTAFSGTIKVKALNKCGEPGDSSYLSITLLPEYYSVGFIAPDTNCVNHAINIINSTTSGTNYYWNFCPGNASNPVATDIGNPQGTLNQPSYITMARQGNACFSFTSNPASPGVSRHYHGTSFRNNPESSVNLGSFGLLTANKVEGIQVKNDNGGWIGFVNNDVNIVRLTFGNSLWNTPSAIAIPIAGMSLGEGLVIIKEGSTWLGFLTNATANSLIRLNFGASLLNTTPTLINMGSVGGLNHPDQLQLVHDNGLWYMFIVNSGNNTLTRISFGNSLLNPPSGTNLGNVGGLNSPFGLVILEDCTNPYGYFTNGVNNGGIGRLTFSGGVAGTVSGSMLPGTYNTPEGFSELCAESDSLFLYATLSGSSHLLRLRFPPCSHVSHGSWNTFTPPPLSYDQTGTYKIRLTANLGLATEQTVCKSIVIVNPPTVSLGPDDSICPGETRILNAGAGYSSYLWSTGNTTQTVTINNPGTYWINATKWGCTASDTIHITPYVIPVVKLGNDTIICDGAQITFDAGACNGCIYQWKDLITGLPVGSNRIFTTGQPSIYACSVTAPNGCTRSDTIGLSTSAMPFITNNPLSKTICSGSNTDIILTSNLPSTSFSWTATGSSSFVSGYSPGNGTTISQVLVNIHASDETVTYTITPYIGACFGPAVGYVVVVHPGIPVSVSISASAGNVCAGSPVNFTATPVNGGTAPVFQWKVNGNNAGGNSPVYSYIPANGDVVNCILTSDVVCPTGNPAASNSVTMTVNPWLPVSVSISASENPYCAGITITFSATAVNGGTSPFWHWKVNGINTGSNNPVYSYPPSNGDVVSCLLMSNAVCPSGNPATSNSITMAENTDVTVSITISPSANPVCPGTPVTFTATPINGGTAPAFQWKKNGQNTGTNSNIYTCTPLNGDAISCVLTSNAACAGGNPATSNIVTMSLSPLPVVTFTRCNDSVTTTNAHPFRLKGGIPLGGTYTGAGVSNGIFHPAVAGSGIHVITYSYTNAALCSASAQSTVTTRKPAAFSCGQALPDIRDNQSYSTVKIGTQCWFSRNLNFGKIIPSDTYQRDNCIVEKYTTNQPPATSRSFYQWDELMQYDDTLSIQGLCPPAWHVPTESDWNILFANWTNNGLAAWPLLSTGYSGFNAFVSGAYHMNITYDWLNFATMFWSSTSHGPNKALAHGMNNVDPSVSIYPSFRVNAFSVRCLKD
ncbi:MAG: hypothetical protein NTX61_18710 [Bacteroidetes bacterium]|nr:hypothetical protein [Bacteroidota bacterium]